ncbi:MAG: hypothetical protein P1U77_29070, partial [Rubripirellula sp.]|nr:hypothetical protein [Rubripirellula sp.]
IAVSRQHAALGESINIRRPDVINYTLARQIGVTVVIGVEHDDIGTIIRLADARQEQQDQQRDGLSELPPCLMPELMTFTGRSGQKFSGV